MKNKNLSIYEQVIFTNNTFNNFPLEEVNINKDNPLYWEKLENQVKLIKEELLELEKAVQERNFKEIRDAVADINVVNFGVAHYAKIPLEKDMQKVFESNLSKVCKTLEDVKETQKFYLIEKGVETFYEESSTGLGYIIKVKETIIGKDGKEYVKGKFLKSRNSFFEPIFEELDSIENDKNKSKPLIKKY